MLANLQLFYSTYKYKLKIFISDVSTYFNRASPIMHKNIHIKTIIYIYHYSMAKETKKRLKTQHIIQYCVFNLIIYIQPRKV